VLGQRCARLVENTSEGAACNKVHINSASMLKKVERSVESVKAEKVLTIAAIHNSRQAPPLYCRAARGVYGRKLGIVVAGLVSEKTGCLRLRTRRHRLRDGDARDALDRGKAAGGLGL
jgi:hypothetical protein